MHPRSLTEIRLVSMELTIGAFVQSMLLLKDKINYKGPNGQGFPAHTEYAGYNHMSKSEHITANFCIDAADVRNGCLEVVPGSHKLDIAFEAQTRIRSDWEASHTWLPVPLSPGLFPSIPFFIIEIARNMH